MKSFIHVHMVWKLQEKLQINYLLKNKAIEFYHRQNGNLFTCHKASVNTIMKYDLGKVAHALPCPPDAEANSSATIAIHGLRVLDLVLSPA